MYYNKFLNFLFFGLLFLLVASFLVYLFYPISSENTFPLTILIGAYFVWSVVLVYYFTRFLIERFRMNQAQLAEEVKVEHVSVQKNKIFLNLIFITLAVIAIWVLYAQITSFRWPDSFFGLALVVAVLISCLLYLFKINSPTKDLSLSENQSQKIVTANKFGVILAVLVIIGAWAFGAVFKNQKVVEEESDLSLNQLVTDDPITILDVDIIDNWETYSNVEYGIEFKYPPDWKYRILNEKDIDDIVQLFSPEAWTEAQKGDKGGITNFMAFRIWKTDAYIKGWQGQSVTIAGESAIDTGWTSSLHGGDPIRLIRFFTDPPVTIEMSALSETKAIEEKILSTFKFID